MSIGEFFDLKVLVILATAKLWMPFAKLLWRAVNPYPHLLTDKRQRREGPILDTDLVNEEWAALRVQRGSPTALPPSVPLRRGFRPVLRRLDPEATAEHGALRRRA